MDWMVESGKIVVIILKICYKRQVSAAV